jgi:type IX secretion system PorP/SprF family membrane protein
MQQARFVWAVALFAIATATQAQDIPLFSQKLTNSFIYNPALAGHTFGSLTYSFRQNYAGVSGAPTNHLLSLHAPFSNYRFGSGFNVYQEDVNFLRNTFITGAFAYHLRFNKFSVLSFGISGEFNSIRANGNQINFDQVQADPVLNQLQNGINKPDFSFGTHYQHRFFKLGIAANRLVTAWIDPENERELSNYYSGYAQGFIPFRGGLDVLEPYVAFRKFSETNDTYDLGVYYTFNNKITFGGATRRGNVVNMSLAYRLSKYLLVGYSRENILGGVGGFVGSSNEFTLRLDFNDQSYQQRFREDYKSSMAYRRKSISTGRSSGSSSPKQLAKAQKKVAAYSPNARFQNNAKLSGGKKSISTRKKSISKGKPTNRRKPTYKKRKR